MTDERTELEERRKRSASLSKSPLLPGTVLYDHRETFKHNPAPKTGEATND